jgi:dynein heavy chain
MVTEVQYGGKITDDLDRVLFNAYGDAWLGQSTLAPNFTFNPDQPVARIPGDFVYSIPDGVEIDTYKNFIQGFPDVDSPEILGLHPNADMTFRVKEVNSLLLTLLGTQPKTSSGGTGATREDIVNEKAEELLSKMPEDYIQDDYRPQIDKMGGLGVPLNIFLFQEVQRFQSVIFKVRTTLVVLMQAIRGEVVLTPALFDALNAMFDAQVPQQWMFTSGGDEFSWISPSLGLWFTGLMERDSQSRKWLSSGRPKSYWLTGFFNGQGFLTAMRQEVTRKHKADKWALDDVVYQTDVTNFSRADNVKKGPDEGCYIHGLFLDGCGWSKADNTLVESEPKVLFTPLPVLYVTAVTKAAQKSKSGEYGPYGGYECPCYKYPNRTDLYLIFSPMLPSRENRPMHWTLRGAALLCSIE